MDLFTLRFIFLAGAWDQEVLEDWDEFYGEETPDLPRRLNSSSKP